MAFTPEEIQAQLDRLKKNTDRTYFTPQSYKNFMPAVLGFQTPDYSQYNDRNRVTAEIGQTATQTANTMAQNRVDRSRMIQADRSAALQKRLLQRAQNHQPARNPNIHHINLGNLNGRVYNYSGNINWGKEWGKDNTPTVGDLHGHIPIGAPLRTVNWNGHSFTVNGAVAPIFISFLDSLRKMGYKPVTIGGFRRGSTIQSGPSGGKGIRDLHSYGLAIDIDPSRNPVGTNAHWHTALPPGVAALAARYGLSWGGAWHSYKDPMHFSVPAMGLQ